VKTNGQNKTQPRVPVAQTESLTCKTRPSL